MNKFKFYFILLITTVSLFSCSKNDTPTYEPPRDYQTQYDVDIVDIEEYLNTNYITVVNHPGFVDDQNVTITKIDAAQPSIMSYKSNAVVGSTNYPQLWSRDASMNGVTYKLYYLVLRPGVGTSPCNVDGVLTSYRGDYLSRDATTKVLSTTKFDENIYPQTFFQLYTADFVIPLRGWSEILPQFKTGTSTIKNDGTVSHYDFGAGVMFLPSGYGYYNNGSVTIPAYAPLVFSFKLYEIQRSDLDNDGVYSYQEDLNNDKYMYNYGITTNYPIPPKDEIRYADDTDKDGIPNFYDVDDDGDNYTTRLEITKPAGTNSGLSAYFPYDPIIDNPLTTAIETETKGIPEYSAAGTPDYTTPTRLRIHLDKAHHTAKP
jgi:hypothetical protein